MFRKVKTIVFVVLLASLLLAACAPAATQAPAAEPTKAAEPTMAPEPTQAPAEEGVDPAALTGDIYTAGSSTVSPLTEAVIEQFAADGFKGQVKNDSIGTGAGFERFCKTGESDIANASRAIKQEEIDNCGKLSPARSPIGFLVGLDALTVVINPENTWATDVTIDQLNQLLTTAEKWSDVDPSWPAEPILRYTPGTDSGTFDFFVEVVIQKPLKLAKLDEAKKLALEAKNLNQSEDDNVLAQGVEGNKYAIGYFGYAYFKEAGAKLKSLTVEKVAPSEKTAEDGSYKLARPLFIYSDAAILKAKPQVAGFIAYYLENVNTVITKVGYFPASEAAMKENQAALEKATQK